MTERLIQCAECSRHVKSCDAACPFCSAPLRAASPPVQEPYRRMTAAAAVAASVASVVGCTTYVSAPVPVATPLYGSPGIVDATAPPSDDGSNDSGFTPGPSGVTFYGSPGIVLPPDANASQTGTLEDAAADAPPDSGATDSMALDAAALDGAGGD